jgi:hypothetical protein
MYSKEELQHGIALPAVLFNELTEATARTLEELFRQHGLDVAAVRGSRTNWLRPGTSGLAFRRAFAPSIVLGLGIIYFAHNVPIGVAASGLLLGAFGVHRRIMRRRTVRGAHGLVRLRPQLTPMPAANRLLAAAAAAVGEVRAPDVGLLLSDLSIELYRLTQRAETLAAKFPGPSSEVDLLRRTMAAAPALFERLRGLAARLDDLDRALAGQTEGELMQTMARLERAAVAPDADRAALAATRRDLEAALERRHDTEQERARLSASLCQLLGWLRLTYHQLLTLKTPAEQEARALEAASAELDGLLAAAAT